MLFERMLDGFMKIVKTRDEFLKESGNPLFIEKETSANETDFCGSCYVALNENGYPVAVSFLLNDIKLLREQENVKIVRVPIYAPTFSQVSSMMNESFKDTVIVRSKPESRFKQKQRINKEKNDIITNKEVRK